MNQYQDEDLVYFYEYGELGEQIPQEEPAPVDLTRIKYKIDWVEPFYNPLWGQPDNEEEGKSRALEQAQGAIAALAAQGIQLRIDKVEAVEIFETFAVNDWAYSATCSVESVSPWTEFGDLGAVAVQEINAFNNYQDPNATGNQPITLPALEAAPAGQMAAIAFEGVIPASVAATGSSLSAAVRAHPYLAVAALACAAWIADSAAEAITVTITGDYPDSNILGLDDSVLWPIAAVGLLYFGAKLK
jgi:hypothetical protein